VLSIIDNARNEQYKDTSICLGGAGELKNIKTEIITQYTENKMKLFKRIIYTVSSLHGEAVQSTRLHSDSVRLFGLSVRPSEDSL